MIYPRFLARFIAWFGGYFWLPCPVCKKPFAGFETLAGAGCVVVKEEDGDHMYAVCPRPSCQAQGEKNRMDYMQARWENYKGEYRGAISGDDPAKAKPTPLR